MTTDVKYFESLYPAESLQEEIGKAIGFIQKGASSQILGLPGVGKSRLLRLLAYNKKVRKLHLKEELKKYHFVYMDFSEVRNRPLVDVTKFILVSLAYSLSEREMTQESNQINAFLKEALEFNDELILFQALKKSIDFLALENSISLVFLIDRFEQYSQDVTEQFFVNLKILRNRAKYKFSCVFALSRPIDMLIDTTTLTEFYEFLIGNSVFMKISHPREPDFRLTYIENIAYKKNEKAKNEILRLTGGHGKLAKIAYEATLSEEKVPQDLIKYLLGHRQMRGALTEIWNYLLPHEKALIKKLASFKTVPEELKFLEHVGLIHNTTLTIPLFTTFITTIKEEKEQFIYDEQRNEIIKGDTNLSDLLTPSEFRLLKHLLLNKGTTCEKEDIINAVWKDSQTQEGVTDQALDQIVYRLRKKIEKDPNNPQYILTVKGKGIKLVE
ncbi:MAG TPA: winged helix-turn-helix domain-containing protein [Candidatus Levybacteria bacterium]|nr:winged helix-turn-helix domain-containing protein [Candidatus Levybacteria bacterium]